MYVYIDAKGCNDDIRVHISVHACSIDILLTVPSADTRTRDGGIVCLSTDVPWTSELLCHPRILGHGVVV